MEKERLETLLYNAIILLEDENNMNCNPKSERLLDALGMEEEEYEEIMSEDLEEQLEEQVDNIIEQGQTNRRLYLQAKEEVCGLSKEERLELYNYNEDI